MSRSPIRALKYLTTMSLPLFVVLALIYQGVWTFLPLAYAFGFIPLMELFLTPSTQNLTELEEEVVRDDPFYDWMIYLTVPVQIGAIFAFLWVITHTDLALYEQLGLVSGLGVMCGTFGINVGHELGHRKEAHERFLAKIALMTSLYMHFYIEHNRGHHKRVSTHDDPATSRYGENVYAFWIRSIRFSYLSAWDLERKRLEWKKLPFWSWENEMVRFHLIQFVWLGIMGALFGGKALLLYMVAALMGILLLETVNYIEHYGLQREEVRPGTYERVQPHHSWNSDHTLGRLLLFELSRHSDHHYLASRKYQILRHHEEAPQMPTGYPGMMVMSLVPPVWFAVMNRKILEQTPQIMR